MTADSDRDACANEYGRRAARCRWLLCSAMAIAWASGLTGASPVQARPEYAMREMLPCGYCHFASGGGGPRNYRGEYYSKHNHTFMGFDDATEASNAGATVGPLADHHPVSQTPPLATGGSLVPPFTTPGAWTLIPTPTAGTTAIVGNLLKVVVPAHPEQYLQLNYDFPTPPPDGATLTVHFRIRGDTPYKTFLLASRSAWEESDYNWIGLGQNVDIGLDFRDYTFTWVVKATHPTMNKICFTFDKQTVPNPQPITLYFGDISIVVTDPASLPLPPPLDPAKVAPLGKWRDPVTGIWFVKIPAGTYRRGTTPADRDALQAANLWSNSDVDEMPASIVEITRPFLLSEKPITQEEWRRVMSGVQNGRLATPSAFKGDGRPVDSVSFDDATLFCKTLRAAAAGRGVKSVYRLPTEGEWEYAARAGSTALLPLGVDQKPIPPDHLKDYCWMNGNAPNATGTAGAKQPNAWGLYDMLGNVWQWCEDDYSDQAYAMESPTDPLFVNPNATEHVLRGGCWYLDAHAVRPAQRGGNLPGFKSPYVGVRLVREL